MPDVKLYACQTDPNEYTLFMTILGTAGPIAMRHLDLISAFSLTWEGICLLWKGMCDELVSRETEGSDHV